MTSEAYVSKCLGYYVAYYVSSQGVHEDHTFLSFSCSQLSEGYAHEQKTPPVMGYINCLFVSRPNNYH